MCGLFGWQVRPTVLNSKSFGEMVQVLATENDRRGGHSWGFYGINWRKNKYTFKKGLGNITPRVDEIHGFSTLMAHTRSATVGEVTVRNAHPFQVGNIIGAHNGCIYNHDELNKRLGRKCEVDSQHIFHHLSEGKDFKDIEGGGAIEWLDIGTGLRKIYLCNVRGSLSVVGIKATDKEEDKDKIGVIWSSSSNTLESAVGKLGLPYVRFLEEKGEVFSVEDCAFYREERKIEFSSRIIPFQAYTCGYSKRPDSAPYSDTGHYRIRCNRMEEYIPGVGWQPKEDRSSSSVADRDTTPFLQSDRSRTTTDSKKAARGFGGSGDFGRALGNPPERMRERDCSVLGSMAIDSIRSKCSKLEEESLFDEPEDQSLSETYQKLAAKVKKHQKFEEELLRYINTACDNNRRRLLHVLNEERQKSIRRIAVMNEQLKKTYMKLSKEEEGAQCLDTSTEAEKKSDRCPRCQSWSIQEGYLYNDWKRCNDCGERFPADKKTVGATTKNPLEEVVGRVYYEVNGEAYGAYCYRCYHGEMDYPTEGWDPRKLEHGKGRMCTVCHRDDAVYSLLLVREPSEDREKQDVKEREV